MNTKRTQSLPENKGWKHFPFNFTRLVLPIYQKWTKIAKMAVLKTTRDDMCQGRCREKRVIVTKNVTWNSHYENGMAEPQKIKKYNYHVHVIFHLPPSDTYPKEMKSLFQRDFYTPCSLQHYLCQPTHLNRLSVHQ